ncbi:MAG: FkbM family methyltransferase [Thermomicrobiales bacterium]|jgi:FkbM family methyltransferase|nr:FkbM family methyltransferase [Thermomicrobiales bacterium]MDF3014807.1 FkbM family methyltransferase [Thermomicrobiales bacterium]
MRRENILGFDIVVPDSVADWDAVRGPDSPWERERIKSMLSILRRGDVLYDIGAEHGWMSVIFGLHVGGENMVLVEPSQDFWPNIKMGWDENGLHMPLATAQAFAGDASEGDIYVRSWTPFIDGPECPAMAYRHPNNHADSIKTVSIDQLSLATGKPPKGITIDVEGAELGVLKGAERTLVGDRPNVWVSVHEDLMIRDFGTTPQELVSYMEGLNFRLYNLGYDHEQHMYFQPAEWRPR